jgi:hypothetical protein
MRGGLMSSVMRRVLVAAVFSAVTMGVVLTHSDDGSAAARAALEPVQAKKGKGRRAVVMPFTPNTRFSITIERVGNNPPPFTRITNARCDYRPPGSTTPIAWEYVPSKTRLLAGNRRVSLVFVARTTVAAGAVLPQPQQPDPQPPQRQAQPPDELKGVTNTGTIIIVVEDDGQEDDPTDPIPVEPIDVDPCN